MSQPANLFERSGDAVWISRELDGRSVGQEFSLPGHGALDELAEKDKKISRLTDGSTDSPIISETIINENGLLQSNSPSSSNTEAIPSCNDLVSSLHVQIASLEKEIINNRKME